MAGSGWRAQSTYCPHAQCFVNSEYSSLPLPFLKIFITLHMTSSRIYPCFISLIYAPLNPIILFKSTFLMNYKQIPSFCVVFSFWSKNLLRRAEQNFYEYWSWLTRNARNCDARSGKVGSSHCYLDRQPLHEID